MYFCKKKIMRLILKTLFVFYVALMFMSSCVSNKNKVSDQEYIYELKRGACFGKCPVFELKIRKDGYALLNATLFNPENGKFEKNLTKAEMKEVASLFKKADLQKLPDESATMVADLPMTKLTDNSTGKKKSVKANEKMPEAYENVVTKMETIVKSEGWKLIEKYEDEKPVKEAIVKDQVTVYDEIIIEPNPGVRLPVWFKEMEAYGVRLIKKIANEQNLWLITYDTKMIEPTLMINLLRKDKSIKFAEFNKKISPRD
jgi:hypothetical protein